MLEIFRRNLFVNNILLFPYIFILRLNAILSPEAYIVQKNDNSFVKLIFGVISDPLIQNLTANLLIFSHALMINYVFIKHKISREITMYAGILYVIFITLISTEYTISPILIANTFIILAVLNLMETYKLPNSTVYIFNTGFFIGLAANIYTPYAAYVIFGVISLLLLRSFKLLEKIGFFIGFFIPYFLIFTYKFLFEKAYIEFDFVQEMFFRLPLLKTDRFVVFYISLLVLLLSVIYAIINYSTYIARKSIQTQKKIDIFYWLMFFSLLSFLLFKTENTFHLVSLTFPISVFIAMTISDGKSRVFYELVHIFVLVLIFINQFKLLNF